LSEAFVHTKQKVCRRGWANDLIFLFLNGLYPFVGDGVYQAVPAPAATEEERRSANPAPARAGGIDPPRAHG
jgi:hypothetical protein